MKGLFIRYRYLLLILSLIFLSCGASTHYTIVVEEINPKKEPVQKNVIENRTFHIKNKKGSFFLEKLAEYTIQARVLHTKKYHYDYSSVLSPIDLVLGWGKFLPLKKFDKYYKVSQFGRWFYFKIKRGAPFTENYFYEHAANNHIIPANNNTKAIVLKIKKGNIIKIHGYLVKISGFVKKKGEFNWQSSLSRKDTGNHSCELIYVDSIQIGSKLYN